MKSYRRFIPPRVPTGDTTAISAFTSLMAARLRHKEQKQLKEELDDWEDEGGSVAAADGLCRIDPYDGQGTGQSIRQCHHEVVRRP